MQHGEPGWRFYLAFVVAFILLGLVFFGSCEGRDSGGVGGGDCVGSQVFC